MAPPLRQLPVYATRSSPLVCLQWGMPCWSEFVSRLYWEGKCAATACFCAVIRLEEEQVLGALLCTRSPQICLSALKGLALHVQLAGTGRDGTGRDDPQVQEGLSL